MKNSVLLVITAAWLWLVPGCADLGTSPPSATPGPVITSILPDSGTAGDTVRISGSGFGTIRSSSVVHFGGVAVGTYIDWNDSTVVVIVPAGSVSGAVTVIVGTKTSNGIGFTVSGTVSNLRSFSNDVLPRLTRYGCVTCHGGNGGLWVDTRAHLLLGGDHGPAIIPGDADGSLLIKKLYPSPPVGSRMPLGGPYLADTTIQVIREWIDQGAPDN